MLLNYENIVDIPLEIKEILEIQKKIDIGKIATSMPHFTDDFIKQDILYRYTLTPQNYANFLLEYLANVIVRISKESTEQYKTMAKLLVKYFTANIIMQERLFSRAEAVFLKLAAITTVL